MSPEQHDRVKRLFLDSCELPAGDRAAFLDKACGDDLDLRREVESLGQFSSTVVKRIHRELGPKGLVALGVLITSLLAIVAGGWLHMVVRDSLRELRAEQLRVHLDADIAALEHRFELERLKLSAIDRAVELRSLV